MLFPVRSVMYRTINFDYKSCFMTIEIRRQKKYVNVENLSYFLVKSYQIPNTEFAELR